MHTSNNSAHNQTDSDKSKQTSADESLQKLPPEKLPDNEQDKQTQQRIADAQQALPTLIEEVKQVLPYFLPTSAANAQLLPRLTDIIVCRAFAQTWGCENDMLFYFPISGVRAPDSANITPLTATDLKKYQKHLRMGLRLGDMTLSSAGLQPHTDFCQMILNSGSETLLIERQTEPSAELLGLVVQEPRKDHMDFLWFDHEHAHRRLSELLKHTSSDT